jgi:hypothetical protein
MIKTKPGKEGRRGWEAVTDRAGSSRYSSSINGALRISYASQAIDSPHIEIAIVANVASMYFFAVVSDSCPDFTPLDFAVYPTKCFVVKISFGVDACVLGVYTYDMGRKETKPRRGRPPVDNPLRKHMIRATDDQWRRWSRAAGENVSLWIRQMLDKASRR